MVEFKRLCILLQRIMFWVWKLQLLRHRWWHELEECSSRNLHILKQWSNLNTTARTFNSVQVFESEWLFVQMYRHQKHCANLERHIVQVISIDTDDEEKYLWQPNFSRWPLTGGLLCSHFFSQQPLGHVFNQVGLSILTLSSSVLLVLFPCLKFLFFSLQVDYE